MHPGRSLDSFLYASARDWGRFGLLLLSEGWWNGRRLLPDGWVEYLTTPTPSSGGGVYGAHVWLGLPEDTLAAPDSPIPEDAYYMLGHEGQMVAIVPSRDLVVVRLGLSRYPKAWNHRKFLESVISTLEPVASE
jgi:CubicO group peptidase (beta-lactamase class C family)